ncbi:hypothetical protein M378DRAFT_1038098 [Amanita muscaria Koide BX008]|uniref:F-box domain-containing protein n=1 Tax=Amanita muscaria (strain Koide BX008) TaxID=946122 RepID=A0A0C2WV27_AMAMK|nr:hypothetical protein M378DRAFT_1038098 [Amanita muscaria Koide BX008]
MINLEPRLQSSPRVPLEVIDRIVELTLDSNGFSAIEAFSRASSTFRITALRRYMRHITPKSKRHWTKLFRFLEALTESSSKQNNKGGFVWVKSICASSRDLMYAPGKLGSFIRLQTLSLDFYHEGLSTQKTRILQLCHNLSPAAFLYLTSLTVTHLPGIDTTTLRLIANAFPELLDLYLSCAERLEYSCCWYCYEDSLEGTIHSPIPGMFSSATSLAVTFANALQPLTKLTHLFLGIFLSDEMLPSGITRRWWEKRCHRV